MYTNFGCGHLMWTNGSACIFLADNEWMLQWNQWFWYVDLGHSQHICISRVSMMFVLLALRHCHGIGRQRVVLGNLGFAYPTDSIIYYMTHGSGNHSTLTSSTKMLNSCKPCTFNNDVGHWSCSMMFVLSALRNCHGIGRQCVVHGNLDLHMQLISLFSTWLMEVKIIYSNQWYWNAKLL